MEVDPRPGRCVKLEVNLSLGSCVRILQLSLSRAAVVLHSPLFTGPRDYWEMDSGLFVGAISLISANASMMKRGTYCFFGIDLLLAMLWWIAFANTTTFEAEVLNFKQSHAGLRWAVKICRAHSLLRFGTAVSRMVAYLKA
jgi:hypothetical protein